MGAFDDTRPRPAIEDLVIAVKYLDETLEIVKKMDREESFTFKFICFVEHFRAYLKKSGLLNNDNTT